MGPTAHPLHRTRERLQRAFPTALACDTAAGAFAGAAVLIPALWWLSIISCAWLFYRSVKQPPKNSATTWMVFMWAEGAIAYLGFWGLYPLDWLGITSPLLGVLSVGAYWVSFSLVPACVALGVGYLVGRTRLTPSASSAAFFASAVLLAGYAGLIAQSLFAAGPEFLFGPHLSVALPGYALAHSPLLPLAALGGPYLLTFAAALLGAAVAYIAMHPRHYVSWVTLFVVTTLLCAPLAAPRARDAGTITVGIVTLYPSRHSSVTEIVDRLLLQHNPTARVDALVLPEESGSLTHTNAPFASYVIGSHMGTGERGNTRQMTLAHNGTITATYDKRYLTPGGEYEPFMFALLTRSLDATGALSFHRRTQGEGTPLFAINSTPIAALFCSEILSPTLYRTAAASGAQLFVNAASHAWFHSAPAIEAAVLAATKVRAVESDRYIVTAGMSTPSTIVSHTGTLLYVAPRDISSLAAATVPLRDTHTVYVRMGDSILLFLLTGLAAPLIAELLRRQRCAA